MNDTKAFVRPGARPMGLLLSLPLLWCVQGIAGELFWPIDCKPGDDSCFARIGYPDIDGDGRAYDCGPTGYAGHQGTDIGVRRPDVEVRAAAAGTVLFVTDDHYDQCPSSHPDCQAPPPGWQVPGSSNGYRVCTPATLECPQGGTGCFACADGGNVVIVRHEETPGVWATRYDHLGRDSVPVSAGDRVEAGQRLGTAASAGASTGPHLHFELWESFLSDIQDPWGADCGASPAAPSWYHAVPWTSGPLLLPPNSWRQISLPARVPPEAATPRGIFGDDIPGRYGRDWLLYAYDLAAGRYAAPGFEEPLVPGAGYWILHSTAATVTIDLPEASSPAATPRSAGCPSADGCAELVPIDVPPSGGWFMLGNPFGQTLALDRIRMVADGACADGCTLPAAEAAGLLHGTLYAYDGRAYERLDIGLGQLADWSSAWALAMPGAGPGRLQLVVAR